MTHDTSRRSEHWLESDYSLWIVERIDICEKRSSSHDDRRRDSKSKSVQHILSIKYLQRRSWNNSRSESIQIFSQINELYRLLFITWSINQIIEKKEISDRDIIIAISSSKKNKRIRLSIEIENNQKRRRMKTSSSINEFSEKFNNIDTFEIEDNEMKRRMKTSFLFNESSDKFCWIFNFNQYK